jgi:hypothetical protein
VTDRAFSQTSLPSIRMIDSQQPETRAPMDPLHATVLSPEHREGEASLDAQNGCESSVEPPLRPGNF